MKTAGFLLVLQEMVANDFREAIIVFMGLDQADAIDRQRINKLDKLTQETAYQAIHRWCEQQYPLGGRAEAAQTLADLEEIWGKIKSKG